MIIYIFDMPESKLRMEYADAGTLRVALPGRWKGQRPATDSRAIIAEMDAPDLRSIRIDSQELAEWDSTLAVFLARLIAECESREIDLDLQGLPEGIAVAEERLGRGLVDRPSR